jgi:hypothetical protein
VATVTEPVTVIINNCNLLTWPRAMVAAIESFDDLAEIVIVDNGSTYSPLLDWYDGVDHHVVRLANIGHRAPWHSDVQDLVKTRYYVVTDPDLDLADTPRDCLGFLQRCLTTHPRAGKIGLGLRIDDVPRSSPYFEHVNDVEKSYWDLPLLADGVRAAPVDTTFAIHDKTIVDGYRVCRGRTDAPYTARHIPWSVVEPDAEFQYYLDHAGPSCSYKTFLGLQ